MGPVPLALTGLGVIVAAMTLLWGLSLLVRDASVVDPFWGPGFFLVAGTYAWAGGVGSSRGWITLALLTLWAIRLGSHLLRRNRREGEDARYRRWRREHGESFWWVGLVRIFWLQGVLLWVVATPLLPAVRSARPLGVWDVLATVVFLAGFFTEAVADAQLHRFRNDPANHGKVLDSGLWRYSRHPNYFGDALLWWGLYLFALAGGGWWSAFGPLLMTVLLLKVSGVTLLEKDIGERRPGYADYVRRTSAFVPMPPADRDS